MGRTSLVHPGVGLGPVVSAVIAAEESDIGVGNELALWIKRVEMNSVAGGDVETEGGPARVIYFTGIDRCPGCASVSRPHRSSEVGRICKVGVLLSHRNI